MAATGTPNEVITRLNDAITAEMQTPEVIARFYKIGLDPLNLGPVGFANRLEADKAMWSALIQQTGLRFQ